METARVEASEVESAVEAARENCDCVVLAVSGGLDSMVLLAAAARLPARKRRNVIVATFDHGTGKAAGRAAALVARQ
jgi:tRNA(Ile)-lysidine synthase TilS/MesJ